MKVVADSGPLISLASIALLNVFRSLFDTLHIPQAVYQEVVIAGRGRAGSDDVERSKWIERHTIRNTRDVEKFMADDGLDNGESEAIVLAKEMKAGLVILDDRTARKCASRQKIPIIGTAGVLLLAKEDHVIRSVKSPLDDLRRCGFYLSHSSYRKILVAAGED